MTSDHRGPRHSEAAQGQAGGRRMEISSGRGNLTRALPRVASALVLNELFYYGTSLNTNTSSWVLVSTTLKETFLGEAVAWKKGAE